MLHFCGGFGDGGFRSFYRIRQRSVEQAFTLKVMASFNLTDSRVQIAIQYLKNHQNSDGSWSIGDNLNNVQITAQVAHSLWLYSSIPPLDKKGSSLFLTT